MTKARYFTRKELYDLVGEELRAELAKQIGRPDVAIAKACRSRKSVRYAG